MKVDTAVAIVAVRYESHDISNCIYVDNEQEVTLDKLERRE